MEPVKILDEAEQKIFNIGEEGSRMKEGFQGMDTLVVELLDRVQEMADNPNDITGVPTGFVDLDRMTSGLQAGDLVVPILGPTWQTELVRKPSGLIRLPDGIDVAQAAMLKATTRRPTNRTMSPMVAERATVLITVKASPEIGRTHGETGFDQAVNVTTVTDGQGVPGRSAASGPAWRNRTESPSDRIRCHKTPRAVSPPHPFPA